MKLSHNIIEEIKMWNGFEEFNGKNIEVISDDSEISSDCEITLLMKAIEEDNVNAVKELCDAGVNVNRIAKGIEQTPLLCISENSINSVEISKILIDKGANVNYINVIIDEIFTSPLINAVKNGDIELIKLLIDNGANVNSDNSSALKMANESSQKNAIELLLKNGVENETNYQIENEEEFDPFKRIDDLLLKYKKDEIDENPQLQNEIKIKSINQNINIKKLSLFSKLFYSKATNNLLNELNIAEQELNNQSFFLVKKNIKKIIFKDSKKSVNNGKSLKSTIYYLISNISGDLFESGKYNFKTLFGEFDNGYHLLDLFEKSIEKLVEMNEITKETGLREKNAIRENMKSLISQKLPFY